MMKCGHVANATDGEGKDICIICSGIREEAKIIDLNPADLKGRIAKCSLCTNEQPSSTKLAFFEYKGPGSREAEEICKHCRMAVRAHLPEVMARNPNLKCTNFEAIGGYERDAYYCGCRGWD